MAENLGVEIGRDVGDLIARRNRLWDDHDEAMSQGRKLEQLAGRVPDGRPPEPLGSLTAAGNAPAEVTAALEQLGRELQRIERLRDDLEQARRREQQTRLTLILVGVIGGLVVIGGITALIVALWPHK